MLGVLLSRNNHFNPPPGFLSLFPGPLSQAIRRHHVDAVKFLLARFDSHGDVDRPDAPNAEGDYPLHSAARLGSIPLVKVLLSHPLSPNININSRTSPGERMTPLDAAANANHLDLVKYLFALPDIWRTGLGGQYGGHYGGKTPIYYAVANQNMEMIQFLIAQAETVITTPQPNLSPIWMATHLGRLDLVEFLLENGRVGSEAELVGIYHSCLDSAISKGRVALFDYFFAKQGIPLKKGLLSCAVASGRREIFEKLVTGTEFNSVDHRDALIRAVAKGDLHLMQRLIDMGNLNLKSADPRFPRIVLSWARGRSDVIELLKRRGIVPHDAVPMW
ncbi:ankyrin repeat-containing domain protein [Aspergillus pseudoustus]|uniref:Ankyrin repeat-containing domain protein n=1 Tax=Aspergillus pseudoustus TaxID=1810923 RepID=A0ABR4ITE5_9EURO